ncbi:hypothetical protein FRB90_006897, partial [Tulasnella sp. 427]
AVIKYFLDTANDGVKNETTPRSLIERVSNEVRIWSKLKHENIAPLLGYAIYPRTFVVTEFYGNGNVLEFVKKTPVAPQKRLSMIRQIASALEYMHRQGFLHGDLKHDNVLVDIDEVPKIIDFGFSYTTAEAE